MMFLLQPYDVHDRGVLDHVLARVSRDSRLATGSADSPNCASARSPAWRRAGQPLPPLLPPMTPPRPRWTIRRRWAGLQGRTCGVSCAARPIAAATHQRKRSAFHDQPYKEEERRTPKDPAPGGAGGGERTRRPRSCGGTPCNELSTSGSASSRSRSGAPARPAAARSPAAWPAHRHSCRPSGRTPAWPWRPPRSSAACAPG
ncbi:hypothetical protein SAMN05720615_101576 [Stenotrophomonas indicatrix]|nr:hypothetical protein SAMN05720615_101576 [Stenotrophomonas indicatrix]